MLIKDLNEFKAQFSGIGVPEFVKVDFDRRIYRVNYSDPSLSEIDVSASRITFTAEVPDVPRMRRTLSFRTATPKSFAKKVAEVKAWYVSTRQTYNKKAAQEAEERKRVLAELHQHIDLTKINTRRVFPNAKKGVIISDNTRIEFSYDPSMTLYIEKIVFLHRKPTIDEIQNIINR